MATYIPKPLQGLTYQPDPTTLDVTEKVGRAVGPAGAVVLASRAIGAARGKFTHIRKPNKTLKDRLKPFSDTGFPDSNPDWEEYKANLEAGVSNPPVRPKGISSYKETPLDTSQKTDVQINNIIIINLDAGENPGDDSYEEMVLHSVPKQLKYDPASNFVGLASIGRNNPHYNYAGSEDTLEFSIDWYCKSLDRAEVINNCRWVEALTKSNGYSKRPPRVRIKWGDEDYLFGEDEWIVVSAGYQLSNFQNSYAVTDNKTFKRDSKILRIGNLPQQAYQNVTLKRVTNRNRTWKQIKNISNLPNNQLIPQSNTFLFTPDGLLA